MICASYTSHMRGAYRYAPRILLCEPHIDMRLVYVKYRRRISDAPRIRNTRGLKLEAHVICASDRLFGAPQIGFSLVVGVWRSARPCTRRGSLRCNGQA